MHYYLDTSAVLKRYKTEKGTEVVTELYEARTDSESLLTSFFTCLEVESVAARALKGRILDQTTYEQLLDSFFNDLGRYFDRPLSVSDQVVGDAIDVARRYALRAPDAVQFATAMQARASAADFVLVASDGKIVSAAEGEKMLVLNPEADGAMERLREWRK